MTEHGFRVMDTKGKVLWDNCARLYNLQPVSEESPGGI